VNFSDVLADLPLIAVLRGITPTEAPAIAAALHDAGLRCLEVTLNSPRPLDGIAAIRDRFDGRLLVGAGTVLTASEVADAATAGAQFIVSPDTNVAVIHATKAAGLVSLPGFFSPTEAFAAIAAGADALKLFPAEAASPAMLKAMLAVLPAGARVFPVGGIAPQVMSAWRAAGASGFGVGSALYRPGVTPDEARRLARPFVAAWRALG
jgi:2-dehydro-3-deoxyphosphogalactonate aldolase